MKKILALLVLVLACAAPAFPQLTAKGNEQVITYSGSTAFVLTNTPVNPNLLTNTGTNTFIMNINPPSNSIRLYITNDTVNPCNNLTVTIASTGNTQLNSFNQNPGAWQALQIQQASGNFGSSQAVTLPATGTVALTSQPIIGSKIAIFIVLSSGCATTNIDAQAVFGAFTATSPFVQGPVAPGASYTGDNPVVVGGVNPDNLNAVAMESVMTPSTSNNPQPGFAIGQSGLSVPPLEGTQSNNITYPNGAVGGPLAVSLSAVNSLGGSIWTLIRSHTANGNTACTLGNGCAGLLVSDAGWIRTLNSVAVTSSEVVSLIGDMDQGQAAAVATCRWDVLVQCQACAASTLDVYIQTSLDNSNWTDVVHFAQFGTTNQARWASTSGANSAATDHVYGNKTTAVGTVVPGGIAPWLRVDLVPGGTTPNYSVNIVTVCK